MFPGSTAQVYRNDAGEPLGWDYPTDPDPYDNGVFDLDTTEYCEACGEELVDGAICELVDCPDNDPAAWVTEQDLGL